MMKASNGCLGLIGVAILIFSAVADVCNSGNYADGLCDQSNNNAECGFDGGDCCSCTCVSTEEWTCGDYGYACIDPDAHCVHDDDVTMECGPISWNGDGRCDLEYNTAICGYDGGDCCECTCVGDNDDDYVCSDFACIDPDAPCVESDITADLVEDCGGGWLLGDGTCDLEYNTAICGYDGGDCCECTCVGNEDDNYYACSSFACIDPDAPCVNESNITAELIEDCDNVLQFGNGQCDQANNNAGCDYDGGDCCECTCVTPLENLGSSLFNKYACDPDGIDNVNARFACVDPGAPCVGDDDITAEMVEVCDDVFGLGDGYCDSGNNNEICGYDGGDCCKCTCVSQGNGRFDCDSSYFDCKDPSAACIGEAPVMDDEDYYSYDDWMSYDFVPFEQDGLVPAVDGAVEVGTKTEVGVTATAYDVRAGNHDNDVGCGEIGGAGCAPQNTRDGISSEVESRWSCAPKLVEDDGPCQIEYTFAEPQDIVAMEVAFWKGDERTRKLKIYLNGGETHAHESFYEGSIYNRVEVEAAGVSTVMLESVELLPDEWISLIEVLIFVTP